MSPKEDPVVSIDFGALMETYAAHGYRVGLIIESHGMTRKQWLDGKIDVTFEERARRSPIAQHRDRLAVRLWWRHLIPRNSQETLALYDANATESEKRTV